MSEDQSEVVEIEAIGLEEWDRDRHTPRAMDENLAALVKQSASTASGPVAAPKLDEGWDDGEAAKPRTTTNTLRRTGAVPAMPDASRKTQAFGVAVQRPATAATSAVPRTVAAVQTKPIAREATAAQKPIAKPAATAAPKATKTSPALTPVAPAAKATKTSPALTPVAPKAAPAQPAAAPATKTPATSSAAAATKPPAVNVKPAANAPAEKQAIKPTAPTSSPKPATKTSAEMQALKPAATTKAPAEVQAIKPAATTKASTEMQALKPAATAKPPATPARASAEMQAIKAKPTVPVQPVAAKPSSELVAAGPVAKESPPVAKSSSEMATLKPAPLVAKSSSEMATLKAQGPMQLPVWPPKAEQAYEDWDDPNAATSIGTSTSPPSGDWDGPRESSVIVDLNAVAARSEAPRRAQTSPITQLTSEQGTTTSGAFVMPVAPAGKGTQPETAIAPSFETLTAPMAPSAASFETVTAPGLPSAGSFETLTAPMAPAVGRAPTPMPFALPLAPPPAEPAPPQRAEHDRASSPDLERASSPQLGARAAAWQTPLPQVLPHAPPATFPSAAGLDYHGADAVPGPSARPEPTEPRIARGSLLATVLPTPKSRRFAAIGVAAAGVLMIVGFAIAGGSSSSPAPVAAKDKPAAASHDSTTPSSPSAPATSQPAAAAQTRVAAATQTDRATTTTDAPTTHPTPGKKQPAKRRISRGKKPVVVDYDKQRDPTPDPDQALAQARAAYATGNQHLFAGEAAAAVTSYRQALAVYPGYVAGYRGLGLAFAQAGDRKAALDAFKTYVKLAPAAKDVALIQKRIANLSVAH